MGAKDARAQTLVSLVLQSLRGIFPPHPQLLVQLCLEGGLDTPRPSLRPEALSTSPV